MKVSVTSESEITLTIEFPDKLFEEMEPDPYLRKILKRGTEHTSTTISKFLVQDMHWIFFNPNHVRGILLWNAFLACLGAFENFKNSVPSDADKEVVKQLILEELKSIIESSPNKEEAREMLTSMLESTSLELGPFGRAVDDIIPSEDDEE